MSARKASMNISEKARSVLNECIQTREAFHRIPEKSCAEFETSAAIFDYLSELNPDKLEKFAVTGVRAVFYADSEFTRAVRADIDALPIFEHTKLPFKSQHSGFMHACGHDGHISMALATAKLVAQSRNQLKTNVVFIFQPAEEDIGGAEQMIEQGVLKNPDVNEIFGLHIWPYAEEGKIAISPGAIMARMCDLNVDIEGKSAHGARPQEGVDALVAAAQFISQTQTILSRDIDPKSTGVITIGKVDGGEARNIICDHVHLEGTIRTYDDRIAGTIKRRITEILKGLQLSMNVDTSYIENMVFPAVVNPPELTAKVRALFSKDELCKAEAVMASEDFSFYQHKIPGVFAFLGSNAPGYSAPLHSEIFDFNPEIMAGGIEFFCRVLEL